MPTENRSSNTSGWIACDDGLHLIQMDESLSHYGWVFRKIDGGMPYSVREATPHEMAHALARQHLRIGVAQVSGQAPAQQDQVEPVTLPQRKGNHLRYDTLMPTFSKGWNACLDELAKLGPLYTHADPGEAERLRSELAGWKEQCHRFNDDAMELWEEHDDLHAQLADQQTADRQAVAALQCDINMLKGGLLGKFGTEELQRVIEALRQDANGGQAASALTLDKAAEMVEYLIDCAEPSAPVERDERADFEAAHETEGANLDRKTDGDYVNPYVQSAWDGWSMRAAFECKPS